MTLENGGVLILSADFMRPVGAAQQGDVRLRLAGTKATLDATDKDNGVLAVVDAARDTIVEAPDIPYWYTTFARHVLGQDQAFMTSREALRIAEITLRIQRVLDTRDTLDLRPSLLA